MLAICYGCAVIARNTTLRAKQQQELTGVFAAPPRLYYVMPVGAATAGAKLNVQVAVAFQFVALSCCN